MTVVTDLWTADEVAKTLKVPTTWVYEKSRQWERTEGAAGIPTVTLGRYRRYRPEAIHAWIKEQEDQGTARRAGDLTGHPRHSSPQTEAPTKHADRQPVALASSR